MIKVMICCMGGFSSSAMTEKLKKEIIEKGYSDKFYAEFTPFHISYERMDEFDIIMTCPHLKYEIPRMHKKYNYQIPIYVLPPRIYGSMDVETMYQDAIDVIEGFKQNPHNPWCFEGEENTLQIKRSVSHKEYMENK